MYVHCLDFRKVQRYLVQFVLCMVEMSDFILSCFRVCNSYDDELYAKYVQMVTDLDRDKGKG